MYQHALRKPLAIIEACQMLHKSRRAGTLQFPCFTFPLHITESPKRLRTMALPAWNLLKGKTAAITGGTTGIGRAIVLEFLRQGCNVAVNHLGLSKDEAHRHSLLQEARAMEKDGAKVGKILELAGDVTRPETSQKLIEEAVSQWGQLDVFVANAGVFKQAELLKYVPAMG